MFKIITLRLLTTSVFGFVAFGCLAFGFIPENAIATDTVSIECYNCNSSSARSHAQVHANRTFRDTDFFVADRANDVLYKYFIVRNPFLSQHSTDQKAAESLLRQRLQTEGRQIVNQKSLLEARSATGAFLVLEIDPTVTELDAFFAFDDLVEIEFGINGPTPIGVAVSTRADVTVPDGAIPGINSAFDILVNQHELNVGLWLVNTHTRSTFIKIAIDKVTATFGNRFIANYEYVVSVTFSDGSNGVWGINNRNEIDLIPGTLRDSNNNVIPQSVGEISPRFFFPGFPNNPNAPRMGGLIDSLPGGGGGANSNCPTTFECGEDGVCTVTLIRDC